MVNAPQVLFLAVVSFLFVHELDAIRQREWRFFFAPFDVTDETAYRMFTALHAPVFVVVLWYMESPEFKIGLSVFAVVHSVLHFSLRNHPKVEFDSWFSRFWIFGGGILGVFYLVLAL